MRTKLLLLSSLFTTFVAAACGPGAAVPSTAARESGQSKLMDQTFAGQNKCNPKVHERPFVIEWDATDTSSFQARTATDVVVVKYDGCNLTVLDSCNDDSVRGLLGSYKPIDWTTGAVEKVDIANAIDLHAKLPLGEALLGGRVQAGEKFHMEYFVSGTRSATRPLLYRAELAKLPGCAGATHFVYAFNLGAYELSTATGSSGEASAQAFGAGVGGSSTHRREIAKKAGELSACKGESAKEIDACKVAIRLTLREITDGENPDAKAARAEETPAAENLAGKLQARTDQERRAAEHLQAAWTKANAEDGKGCLAELDAHDRLDARPEGLSTNPKGQASLRARCIMLSGQCAAGRALARKAIEARGYANRPEQVDDEIDMLVGQSCRGGGLTERDRLLVALNTLTSNKKRTVADCRRAYDETAKLIGIVPKRNDSDPIRHADSRLENETVKCFAEAGDCAAAWKTTKDTQVLYAKRVNVDMSLPRTRYHMVAVTKNLCSDKDQGPMTDAEASVRWAIELREIEERSPALCASRLDKGIAALKKVVASGGGVGADPYDLAKGAAKCFAAVNDCETAWTRYIETRRVTGKTVAVDFSTLDAFQDAAPACAQKPAPASLSPAEKLTWARAQLRKTKDAAACKAAWTSIEKLAPAAPTNNERRAYDEWRDRHRGIPDEVAGCFDRASECTTGWTLFQSAAARFDPEKKPTDYRSAFSRATRACRRD